MAVLGIPTTGLALLWYSQRHCLNPCFCALVSCRCIALKNHLRWQLHVKFLPWTTFPLFPPGLQLEHQWRAGAVVAEVRVDWVSVDLAARLRLLLITMDWIQVEPISSEVTLIGANTLAPSRRSPPPWLYLCIVHWALSYLRPHPGQCKHWCKGKELALHLQKHRCLHLLFPSVLVEALRRNQLSERGPIESANSNRHCWVLRRLSIKNCFFSFFFQLWENLHKVGSHSITGCIYQLHISFPANICSTEMPSHGHDHIGGNTKHKTVTAPKLPTLIADYYMIVKPRSFSDVEALKNMDLKVSF